MTKKFLCGLFAAMFMTFLVPSSYALDAPIAPIAPAAECSSEGDVTTYADVIVYQYRIYNGKYQYRRWNETRGYWVDPYWIDVPGQ